MPYRRLREALDRHAERRTDIQFDLAIQPMPNGKYLVFDACRNLPVQVANVAGGSTFAPGSAVTIGQRQGGQQKVLIGLPPPGAQGVSSFAVNRPPGQELDRLSVITATPDQMEPGGTYETTLFGGPFLEDPLDTFDAVLFDGGTATWIVDTEVTVSDVVWVSAEEVTATITLDPSITPGRWISIRARRS